jgi:hypothetical protein
MIGNILRDIVTPFVLCSVLLRVYRLFQSAFATECDVVLHISVSNILSFP